LLAPGTRAAEYAAVLLRHGFRLLNFGAPLESMYRAQEPAQYRFRNRLFLAVGFLIVLGFDAIQPNFAPDVDQLVNYIRLVLLCPLIALSFIITYLPAYQRFEYPCLALTNFANCVTVIFSMYFSKSPESVHFHSLLMLGIVYGNLLLRLPFWFSMAWTASVMMVYGLTLGLHSEENALQNYYVTLFLIVCVAGLVANYVVDFRARHDFLQSIVLRSEKEKLEKTRVELYRAAVKDVTTGLYNRRYFDLQLGLQWRRSIEEKRNIALLFVDVDCFKRFNDYYGHQAGDECLRKVAETLASIDKRPMDLIARYGGEEFVVLLPGMSWQRAQEFAERARIAVLDLGIEHRASLVCNRVTVSIGVAVLQAERGMKPDQLIQVADNALYQAKREGRNRVCGPVAEVERV